MSEVKYVGLLKNRHVYLALSELKLYYSSECSSTVNKAYLKKEVKSFELTPYFLQLIEKTLLNNTANFQNLLLKFVNDSKYLNVKVHSLSLIGLPLKSIQAIITKRNIRMFENLNEINEVIKGNITEFFVKTIVKELKSNKYTIIPYVRYTTTGTNDNIDKK